MNNTNEFTLTGFFVLVGIIFFECAAIYYFNQRELRRTRKKRSYPVAKRPKEVERLLSLDEHEKALSSDEPIIDLGEVKDISKQALFL